jgi:hypothetical protein
MEVDHIDNNKLNNQKSNLRLATHHQNQFNSNLQRNNTSGYIGVVYHKNYKKNKISKMSHWHARIKFNSKHISLGYYQTPEEAAKAYDKKAKELFGEFAKTNF